MDFVEQMNLDEKSSLVLKAVEVITPSFDINVIFDDLIILVFFSVSFVHYCSGINEVVVTLAK